MQRLRRQVITAVFSDDYLLDRLVLKGGNALELVYAVGDRATVDVDFSMPGDFRDPLEVGARLQHRLGDRFEQIGYRVFDYDFSEVPPSPTDEVWGGYVAKFKLASGGKYERNQADIEKLRREAVEIGPNHERVFKIEISKHEFCEGKLPRNLDDYEIFVYSPAMLAVEKLRAICQQHPAYPLRSHSASRARDFYDIRALENRFGPLLDADLKLVVAVFAAKKVPLPLLGDLRSQRDLHEETWLTVVDSVRAHPGDFQAYFDFLLRRALEVLAGLQSAGHV